MKLTVSNLGKQYKSDFWGLKEFSLAIKPGILGLLGPNGAGKSRFMRMLATITRPTSGTGGCQTGSRARFDIATQKNRI